VLQAANDGSIGTSNLLMLGAGSSRIVGGSIFIDYLWLKTGVGGRDVV
jgi:hypothetical protein